VTSSDITDNLAMYVVGQDDDKTNAEDKRIKLKNNNSEKKKNKEMTSKTARATCPTMWKLATVIMLCGRPICRITRLSRPYVSQSVRQSVSPSVPYTGS